MFPKLIFVTGLLKGTTFELAEDETSIGRDLSNQVSVMDKGLSRRHCLLRREAERYTLIDLDSHNGTFVNGMPIKEHPLTHGDRIQLGSSLLFFLQHEDGDPPPARPIQIDKGDLVTASMTVLKPEDALYAVTRDLNVLIKVSAAVNSLRSLPELQRRLTECILEVIPADQAAIVLAGDSLEETGPACVLGRPAGRSTQLRVSRTVAQRVLTEKVAVLCDDITGRGALSESESLLGEKIGALLCVPLVVGERAFGFIYLVADEAGAAFTKWDLQMATAIAGFAAGALDNASYLESVEAENERLRAVAADDNCLVGESQRMSEVFRFVARVAPAEATVLIRGESGTGKELVARAIHRNSPRAGKPFVAINCATLTETLLESELFGYEKGAFTGAFAQRRGKLEAADGGVVFLDEVGELSVPIQAKLLRVLQEREFERVGGVRTVKVDIRIVAATNRDLEAAIRSGGFRQDLYYRLNVISLTVPALRERPGDVSLLAQYFVAKYARKCNRRVVGLSAEARRCLVSYAWPGNVRELENAIERAIVLGRTDQIQVEDLPEPLLEAASASEVFSAPYYEAVREAKREIMLRAFAQAGGDHRKAAGLLGVHPNNLHRLIRDLDLKQSLKQ